MRGRRLSTAATNCVTRHQSHVILTAARSGFQRTRANEWLDLSETSIPLTMGDSA
jgi:hypothetical protein